MGCVFIDEHDRAFRTQNACNLIRCSVAICSVSSCILCTVHIMSCLCELLKQFCSTVTAMCLHWHACFPLHQLVLVSWLYDVCVKTLDSCAPTPRGLHGSSSISVAIVAGLHRPLHDDVFDGRSSSICQQCMKTPDACCTS